MSKVRIAILASGRGSNADKICKYMSHVHDMDVNLIISNKVNAGVKLIAEENEVPFLHISNDDFKTGFEVLKALKAHDVDFIILAGFLRKIPESILDTYPDRMINIHPALLPNYGGKGMYGHHVHEAVIANRETESGISIHLVNKNYDEGRILFQAKCEIDANDTPEILAQKIHHLEHEHFPKVIEDYIRKYLKG